MFEWLAGEKKWGAMHHPFTRPQSDNPEAIKKDPAAIKGFQHDFVLNGFEIGGGSLRNTNLETMTAVFEVIGHTSSETKNNSRIILKHFPTVCRRTAASRPALTVFGSGFERTEYPRGDCISKNRRQPRFNAQTVPQI